MILMDVCPRVDQPVDFTDVPYQSPPLILNLGLVVSFVFYEPMSCVLGMFASPSYHPPPLTPPTYFQYSRYGIPKYVASIECAGREGFGFFNIGGGDYERDADLACGRIDSSLSCSRETDFMVDFRVGGLGLGGLGFRV